MMDYNKNGELKKWIPICKWDMIKKPWKYKDLAKKMAWHEKTDII